MKKQNLKRLILIGLVLIISGGAIGFYMYNKPHKNYAKLKPDFVVQANVLFSEFETDEISANEKYLGKLIQVNGSVISVTNTDNGDVCISYIDEMFGVSCTINNAGVEEYKNIIASINPGDQISIKGRCDGMLTDVRLSECSVISD